MNYQAFTNSSLALMHEGLRGALDADDLRASQNRALPFRVRETPDWKLHAAELEFEMLRRGIIFELIDWSKGLALAGGPKRTAPH
jgi:hypothetical protein